MVGQPQRSTFRVNSLRTAILFVIACSARLAGDLLAAELPLGTDFEAQIRPILAEHCTACHGPEKQRGGLRLDVRHAAFHGGDSGPVIVAGQSDASELLRRVLSDDESDRMPPNGARLAPAQQELLRAWIDAGAVWPETEQDRAALGEQPGSHWAFAPVPETIPVPRAAVLDLAAPAQNEIDLFIAAALQERGLTMSPEADRRTLIRRLSLDLLGLPPRPEQVEAFLADEDPLAYEKLVDQLLASPRYGERWAQLWLDTIRYADTHGFEVNTPRDHAWPYRDYVIGAWNDDVPYDQFVRQQLTGDQLGCVEATGFLVAAAALLPGQIGADDASKRLARQDALDEVITGVSGALLGITLGCARCHDHKFDPFTQRDYYALQACFAGLEYGDRPRGAGDEQVFAALFRDPDPTMLLRRGDPEQPIEPQGPAVPAALGTLEGLSSESPENLRRSQLAAWIAAPANPLTARVFVNRLWLGHFGSGLVATPNDFGRNGAAPSHPRLLDWLARQLMDAGWSTKRLQRLIVLSRTYRQASAVRPEAAAIDSQAALLWRYPARRVEAEVLRDGMLMASGELNLQMGGPGFNFFQSRGGLNGFPPLENFGAQEFRRMIYAHKVRMEPVPIFGAFDCPDAGQAMPQRGRSTTAIQALNLFNSPFMMDRASVMAERIVHAVGSDEARGVQLAFLLTLQRAPDEAELVAGQRLAATAGLAAVCRTLLNCNEFVFLP